MCAWLKELPTVRRGRNKEERHRKLLICAPDCQSATGALHYRHEERSSAFSNPSVLFNYTPAPRTNTHTRDRACAQLHSDKEETMQISLSSLAHRLQLRIKEKTKLISLIGMRRKAAGVEGSYGWHGHTPSMHLSAVFQPLLTCNKSKHISTGSHQVRSLF